MTNAGKGSKLLRFPVGLDKEEEEEENMESDMANEKDKPGETTAPIIDLRTHKKPDVPPFQTVNEKLESDGFMDVRIGRCANCGTYPPVTKLPLNDMGKPVTIRFTCVRCGGNNTATGIAEPVLYKGA